MTASSCCAVDVETCDTFEFMQNVVGLPILHPGGLSATDTMARLCGIDLSKNVLDIACGPGFNDDHLAVEHGCSITGVDINSSAIDQAQRRAQAKGLQDKLRFMLADAHKLPFGDNEFDVTLFQAVLIMVKDQPQAVREAVRVTKPGGFVGVLELTWKTQPPSSFFDEAKHQCVFFANARTAHGWKDLIFGQGLTESATETHDMECPCGFKEMGFKRTARVLLKQVFDRKVRTRMRALDGFIKQNDRYFGYGIYTGRKTQAPNGKA